MQKAAGVGGRLKLGLKAWNRRWVCWSAQGSGGASREAVRRQHEATGDSCGLTWVFLQRSTYKAASNL